MKKIYLCLFIVNVFNLYAIDSLKINLTDSNLQKENKNIYNQRLMILDKNSILDLSYNEKAL